MNNGYLYIATGKKYVDEAIHSVNSLRTHNPDIHATLITDKMVDTDAFDHVKIQPLEVYESNWKTGTLYKVKGLQDSPYHKTFYLDADTYFCADCSELFEILDYYDFLIAHAPSDHSITEINGKILEGYTPYNTGIMVFNKNHNTQSLLKDWFRMANDNFERYANDQVFFMEALLLNNVRLYVLQPVYNFRIPFFVSLPKLKVKILHGHTSDFEKLNQQVNKDIFHRVWDPFDKKIIHRNRKPKVFFIEKFPKLYNWYKKNKNPF